MGTVSSKSMTTRIGKQGSRNGAISPTKKLTAGVAGVVHPWQETEGARGSSHYVSVKISLVLQNFRESFDQVFQYSSAWNLQAVRKR